METISLVVWEYSDKSGWGIVRAYMVEEEAIDCMKMLEENADSVRKFSIIPVLLKDDCY